MRETLEYVDRGVIPAAFGLLPSTMCGSRARAMLLAIGLQESRFEHRVQQPNGPAHGFWQFERNGGVRGVITHRTTGPIVALVCNKLCYTSLSMIAECYQAIVHNDVLACVFARLLLWTLPAPLPHADQCDEAWRQYIEAWRPGKPHRHTWDENFAVAWRVVGAREIGARSDGDVGSDIPGGGAV